MKEPKNIIVSRCVTQHAINALKSALIEQNWADVYVENVNTAFDEFLKIFNSLYDSHCPVTQKEMKHTFAKKLWITKGIQKACIKKIYQVELSGIKVSLQFNQNPLTCRFPVA